MADLQLRAPFPWYGGKSRVAHLVWPRLGPNVPNYIEPFFGSGAMLLGRPGGPGKIETGNDIDRYVANFWRAVTAAPDEVAQWADWPVSEPDMHARHKWLVNQREFREQMHSDPDFYDVKIAGYWVFGLCIWIGGGWCAEPNNHKVPRLDGIGKGTHSAYSAGLRPALSTAGQGIFTPSRQFPFLGGTEGTGTKGVDMPDETRPHAKLPRLGGVRDSSTGVHLPSLGNDKGIHGVAAPPCLEWFRALQERLRRVRVACGDWTRVLGPSVLGKGKNVGGRRPCAVFLDPPYSRDLRARHLYAEDDEKIAERVRAWAIEHGDDPDLRICLAGYWEEHAHAMPMNWRAFRWKAARGYAGAENENREQETLWFSPHCLPEVQTDLFTPREVRA